MKIHQAGEDSNLCHSNVWRKRVLLPLVRSLQGNALALYLLVQAQDYQPYTNPVFSKLDPGLCGKDGVEQFSQKGGKTCACFSTLPLLWKKEAKGQRIGEGHTAEADILSSTAKLLEDNMKSHTWLSMYLDCPCCCCYCLSIFYYVINRGN